MNAPTLDVLAIQAKQIRSQWETLHLHLMCRCEEINALAWAELVAHIAYGRSAISATAVLLEHAAPRTLTTAQRAEADEASVRA